MKPTYSLEMPGIDCNYSLPFLVLNIFDNMQLKKVLSSIPETMLNVECLANDVDVSSKMTREIFEEKSKSILERVKLPLQKASFTRINDKQYNSKTRHLNQHSHNKEECVFCHRWNSNAPCED